MRPNSGSAAKSATTVAQRGHSRIGAPQLHGVLSARFLGRWVISPSDIADGCAPINRSSSVEPEWLAAQMNTAFGRVAQSIVDARKVLLQTRIKSASFTS